MNEKERLALAAEEKLNVYKSLVLEHFNYLIIDYGFKLLSVNKVHKYSLHIKYVSSKVYVELLYGPPGYELDLYFGRLGIDDTSDARSFNSTDLLYQNKNSAWFDYSGYSACSYENLNSCIPRLSMFLRECGDHCLRGDNSSFEKIKCERDKDYKKRDKQEKVKAIQKEAEAAWKEKDYVRVMRLLNSINNDLSPLERKRLEYSIKHGN